MINVFDASWNPIAGNDDSGGTLASFVTIPGGSSVRLLIVVTRAYSQYDNGTATLRITVGSASSYTPISLGGASSWPLNRLAALTRVQTVEQLTGPSDTMLIVTSGSAGNAIAGDDDTGVGYQALKDLPVDCPNCRIAVGGYPGQVTGPVRLIIDEDAHSPACDNDGLSDALEAMIGTDPCNPDTDGDGLKDGDEFIGIDGPTPVKLGTWGADPTQPDMFVELDWKECKNPDGSTCSEGIDYFKPPPVQVQDLVEYYRSGPTGTPVHVHVDYAAANGASTDWNDFGGSERLATKPAGGMDHENGCETELGNLGRLGFFHHVLVTGYNGGGQGDTPGHCARPASILGRNMAHELGHNLYITHGGSPEHGDSNCKPNYPSIMNYA